MLRKLRYPLVFVAGILAAAGLFLLFQLLRPPMQLQGKEIGGYILANQEWSGTITVVQDTTFVPWVKLTIKPGTRVRFEKKPDGELTDWTEFADQYIKEHNDPTGRTGYNATHFMLVAKMVAVGTKDRPILFTSAQASPDYADWDQLVLLQGSRLENVEVEYAHNGVNIDGDNVAVRNSKIHDSLWSCIDIFSVENIIESNEVYHCWHQAIGVKVKGKNLLTKNDVHDAQLGVNCEFGADPEIRANRFAAAPINPECPPGENKIVERPPDSPGGTYGGKLIYPSLIAGSEHNADESE